MLKLFVKLKTNTSGATAIEYGLIAALIAVVLIGTVTAIGTDMRSIFGEVSTGLGGDGEVTN